MSGMVMKFTSLAQLEANQFVSADDRLYLQEAEDFGAGVAAGGAMVINRSAGGLCLRETRTDRGKHYRIYQLDTAGHILTGHSVVCRSDAEAMDAACGFAKQAAAVEVWESTRRVGCLSTAAMVRRDWCHSTQATIGSGGISAGSGGCGTGKLGVGTGSGVLSGGGVFRSGDGSGNGSAGGIGSAFIMPPERRCK